jgi:hypothetical protein
VQDKGQTAWVNASATTGEVLQSQMPNQPVEVMRVGTMIFSGNSLAA